MDFGDDGLRGLQGVNHDHSPADLVALHMDVQLSLVQRSLVRDGAKPWGGIALPVVMFGRGLFSSGTFSSLPRQE